MSDDEDSVFHEFDDLDEDTKRAEQTCLHKREKRFRDWMNIAWARAALEEMALDNAGVEPEENPGYKSNPDYQAAIGQLKQNFPCLLGYGPGVCKQLSWLNDNGSALCHWHDKLAADEQAKLTSPSIIRKRYEAGKGTTEA